MRFDEAYSGNVFIESHPNFEESEAVIYGMPMDWTVAIVQVHDLAQPYS